MKSQFPDLLFRQIQSCGVIAVLVIDDADHAVPLAKALLDGGINVMELTLRTEAAVESLQNIRRGVPEMIAGVGTILQPEQVSQVADAGAAFGVAPGLNPLVVRRAHEVVLPFAPGVVTPTDIETAIAMNCRDMKFFPAQASGGVDYFNSVSAPYDHLGLHYIPLGGVNQSNMIGYLSNDSVPAVGGSWIATRLLIAAQDWTTITDNARATREAIDAFRNGTQST
ncbi:MAG: bifunctional 4-hydroxy-2-oxoglutarate aldolase/2-dehydro-3-deoxy-phosphogluconate aldolase [Pirellulaceae bacterium]|nr:bifunctional 4-hydroxy-2-oxoglutarate aldolase/2-dehydro-3-deoxy-phosphogluconate aldolase [Pirellulaceae bacterium]